jgi:hypothetical protein
MTKIISFEKFQILHQAGISELEARALHHTPQCHSASDNMVQTEAQRAQRGQRGRWY